VLLRLIAKPGGGSVEQLPRDLSSLSEPMSAPDVAGALKSLQGVVLSDGVASDFVAESGGVWRAVDV
jgi:hypothetical protein